MKKLNEQLTKWKHEAGSPDLNYDLLMKHLYCDLHVYRYRKNSHKFTCIYKGKLTFCNAIVIKCDTCNEILTVYKSLKEI